MTATAQPMFRRGGFLTACLAALGILAPLASAFQKDEMAAGGAQPEDESAPLMFRLHSGGVLWGALKSHTPEGLEVLRLDTGGLVRMPWSFLDPDQSDSLRLAFGYVQDGSEELMVDAMRIRLVDGREVVGLVDGRSDEFLFLRTTSGRLPIPLASLSGAPTKVQVPALDVFTKEELFQRKAQELADRLALEGEAGAEAHVELALFAEGLFDYVHALDHFTRAAVLAPGYRPDFVSGAIARTGQKAALQEQVDFLTQVDRLRGRKRFAQAVEMLEKFNTTYPDSPLLNDWNRMRERVAKHQERYLREEVVRLWHTNAVKLTRTLVRKAGGFEEVVAALDGELSEALEAKLVEDLQDVAAGIEADEMRRFWEERGRGRIRSASYGIGTWLLGEERALSVPEKKGQEPKAAPRTARDDSRRELEERLKRYFRNQEVQRRAQGGAADDGMEAPEDFWKRWSLSSRAQWALAYFTEFSGEFQVARVRLSNCRECGGTGAKQVLFTGSAIAGSNSGTRLFRCPVCHGLGRVRRIQYR